MLVYPSAKQDPWFPSSSSILGKGKQSPSLRKFTDATNPPCYIKEVSKFELEVFRNSWICKNSARKYIKFMDQTAKTSMIVHCQATPNYHCWNFLKKFEISQTDSHVVLLHNMYSSDSHRHPSDFSAPVIQRCSYIQSTLPPRIAKVHCQATNLVCFTVCVSNLQIHCQL